MSGGWQADVVLALHLLFVAGLLGGYVGIMTGLMMGRSWARWGWLRRLHLSAAVFIGVRVWLDLRCPLSELESWLRDGAGSPPWADLLLFRNVQAEGFSLAATVFASIVIVTFIMAPPRLRPLGRRPHSTKEWPNV